MTEESIRALARSFLKKNNLYSFPVNLYKAAKAVGAIIIFEKLPPKISGLVIEVNNPEYPYIIGVNISKPFNHKRFTIAHEIGHIVLNHLKKQQIMCEISNSYELKNNKFEREANIFASELLVPTDKLKQITNMNYSTNSLSKFFQVSQDVIKFRIEKYFNSYSSVNA